MFDFHDFLLVEMFQVLLLIIYFFLAEILSRKFLVFSAQNYSLVLHFKNKLIGKHENAFEVNEGKDALRRDALSWM